MQLAEFATKSADFRRLLAWRLTFGVWALLIAANFYLSAERFPIWVGLVIIGFYGTWLQANLNRTGNDQRIAWEAANEANRLMKLGLDLTTPSHIGVLFTPKWYRKHLSVMTSWSFRLHFWFTVGLVIIFYLTKVDQITFLYLSLT